eukprot:358646-Chlamydomonas_euryale.AAC.2
MPQRRKTSAPLDHQSGGWAPETNHTSLSLGSHGTFGAPPSLSSQGTYGAPLSLSSHGTYGAPLSMAHH